MDHLQPLVLHGMGSPNVRKVLIALEELALPYDVRHVDVFGDARLGPDFAALNPLRKVPILEDPNDADGGPLFESGAILIYLAETYGGLLAGTGASRHAAIRWLMVQMAWVGPMLGQNSHFRMRPGAADTYAAARYANEARKIYGELDRRLAVSPWLGGEDYSIADIATWPWMAYLKWHGVNWLAHPHLDHWSRQIARRPAVVRASARHQGLQALDVEARRRATTDQLDRFYGRKLS